jgi:hypothetical protein
MKSWLFEISPVIGVIFSFAAAAYVPQETVYVKEERENLRDAPNGNKIGQLLQRTELKVIEEKGNWVRVSVTGWIYRPSVTEDLASIKPKTHRDRIPAGNGFYYHNVSLRTGALGAECVGEMTNNSGRGYQLANFVLSLYDGNDRLLETAYILISNIENGVTKSFQTFLMNTPVNHVSAYKIQFESGL